jgi:acyl-CoA thioesterase
VTEAISIPDFQAAIRVCRDATDGGLSASPPPFLSNARKAGDPLKGAPFGGLMAALTVDAARTELAIEAPLRTLSVQFLAGARFEPLRFTAQRLRGHRSTVFATVRADQGPTPIFSAHLLFGIDGSGPEHRPLAAPPMRAPAVSQGELDPGSVPWFTEAVEYRFAEEPGFHGGRTEAAVRGWFRMRGGRALDDLQLCFLLDAVFPNFFVVTGPMAATSVDLRYDFFGPITPDVSPDGWVRFEFVTRDAAHGWAVEDGTAWAPDGRPLAVARQIRKVLAKRV